VARRIQQASLPREVPELEGWQISPHYRPAREVGGDFYDFHFLSNGRLGLVVGDATGKSLQRSLSQPPAACFRQSHKPWTPILAGGGTGPCQRD
jgi:serine phosphatase RsbU (regulator of sigma subunit)